MSHIKVGNVVIHADIALGAFNVIPLSSTLEFLYSGPSDKHQLDYKEESKVEIYFTPLATNGMLECLASFNSPQLTTSYNCQSVCRAKGIE
jgi:hypothetical protein